jgi:hypothetical protein
MPGFRTIGGEPEPTAELTRNRETKRYSLVEDSQCAKSEGHMCLVAEIVHTCSNEKVAQAAVASLGTEFANRVDATARLCGMSAGAFAARTVRQFDNCVGERERQALREAMRGSDQPILFGLHQILQTAICPGCTMVTQH